MTEAHSWLCQGGKPAQVWAKKPPEAGEAWPKSGAAWQWSMGPSLGKIPSLLPEQVTRKGTFSRAFPAGGQGLHRIEACILSSLETDRILLSQPTLSCDIPPQHLALEFLRTQTQTGAVEALSSRSTLLLSKPEAEFLTEGPPVQGGEGASSNVRSLEAKGLALNLALLLTSGVTVGKLFHLFAPQVHHLRRGGSTYLIGQL